MSTISDNRKRLIAWRDRQIEHARIDGKPFFMDLPEEWYEPPTWGCENGHVSSRYLKCEEDGCVCLACHCPIYLIPRIEEAELTQIVNTPQK